jgi:oxygen-independent coproporphyrinogen-3 oxidase
VAGRAGRQLIQPLVPDAPLGLYVHVPFCSAICNYCNFNRGLFDAEQKDRYLGALIAEIAAAPAVPGPGFPAEGRGATPVDSIYFGGGTPSLLSPSDVGSIISACRRSFDVSPVAEITLEANPETTSPATLVCYLAAGVTRLSYGVQSFRDSELARLSRLHGSARARAAYGEARSAGFTNVSLDLMMWLPGQRVTEWLESVDAAIELAPEHLSLYMLEVYPNAPLRDEMARAQWSQAPDDDAAEMYVAAMERLERAGYEQYEISNVSRPGFRSRHNLKYWQDGEWRGFGCGAHSTRRGVRWKNISATDEYIARGRGRTDAVMVDVRRLTRDERAGEAMFTALRVSDGIPLDQIRTRYGIDVWARYGEALDRYVEAGLLVHAPDRLTLTRRGMLLAHEVMAVFV